ncbi:MAG: hypothetical protein JWN89_695 [Parcubacteria group bacterium]|nr:hypothetical protein [Parcubacteria group bacterium]
MKAKKILAVLLVLAVLTGLSMYSRAFVFPYFEGQVSAVMPALTAYLTNKERSQKNLQDLAVDPLLTEAAVAKAKDMATRGYFAHTDADGNLPWTWLDKAGYRYEYAGENLALNFEDSSEVVTAWMNSPLHKKNILGKHYTQIGIGTAAGTYQGKPATFTVQFFASPARK